MDTAELRFSERELRVLMYLVDNMSTTDSQSFGMTQIDVSNLFLTLSDAHSDLEDRRIMKSNSMRKR